jgi:prophage regulatory protein
MTDRTHDRLVRLPQVLDQVPLSEATIRRRMKKGTFPKSVRIGENSIAWYESDIARWKAAPTDWKEAA